jgi:hypothetical protein
MFNCQLERAGAGYCFDGIDSNGQNVAIQLKGRPIVSGAQGAAETEVPAQYFDLDTYWDYDPNHWSGGENPKPAPGPRPQNPELWICHETYFRLSVDEGVVYCPVGIPPNTQATQ